MQISKKSLSLAVILIFTLILSVSFACAQDATDANDLATANDKIIYVDNDVGTELSSQINDTAISRSSNDGILGDYEVVEAIPQIDTGKVSGGVDFVSVDAWGSTSGSLSYTIPDGVTSIKSAKVIVNIYSGSGANNYGLYSNVTLNTNNGLELLGYETLVMDKEESLANDPNVYKINDHTTRQYSDYQMLYDITDKVSNLNSGDSIEIDVVDTQYPGKQFDGKIKLIALLFAYDNGGTNNFTYWFNAGQLWTSSSSQFNFQSGSYSGKRDNISLKIVALSSATPVYYINTNQAAYDSIDSGAYYKYAQWENIANYFVQGTDTQLSFDSGVGVYGNSLKVNTALMVASEVAKYEQLIYVDNVNGNDENDGSSLIYAVKTINQALSMANDGAKIYISGNYNFDGVGTDGFTIDKNISVIGINNAILNANNAGRIFTITNDANLANLTFVNGNCLNSNVNGKHGGAVFANGVVLNIDNCKFINNTAGSSGSYGGAVDVKASTAHIKDSTFEGNSAYYCGGGAYAESGNVLLNISNCLFTKNAILNTGWASGAAIYAYGTVLVDTSQFYNNSLADGKNGKSIDHYGSNQLVVSNSVLLDGDKSVNAQTPSVATLDNNWWGNNDTDKDTNPKDLGYTNANVDSYLYLNVSASSSEIYIGDEIPVCVSLISTDGSEVSMPEIPVTVTASSGSLDKSSSTLINGESSFTFTASSVDDITISADVLGITDTLSLNSEEPPTFDTVYVDYANGNDVNSGNDWSSAVKTIEKALERVNEGGTIKIAEGTVYLSESTPASGIAINKNVAIVGQSINSIVSGSNSKRIFNLNAGYTLTIDNLTLTEGYASGNGGAILVAGAVTTEGKLIISNSVISNSRATSYGGAINSEGRSLDDINNVSFIGNRANDAGALCVSGGTAATVLSFNDCKFINNTCALRGGAVRTNNANIKVNIGNYNLFDHNVAAGSSNSYGGAVFAYGGLTMGVGNVFINNYAAAKGGVFSAMGSGKTFTGSYAIFINNTAGTAAYSIIGCNQDPKHTITLENCYWGTNEPNWNDYTKLGSNAKFTHNSYMVLGVTANETDVHTGDSALITVDLSKNQNGAAVDVNSLPKYLPIEFTAVNGNVNPTSIELADGVGTTTYTGTLFGDGSVTANLYSASETVNLNVLAIAGTVFVDSASGSDTNDGSSWENAVKSIKQALTLVGNNCPIYVADGTYGLDGAGINGLTIDKPISIIAMGDNVIIDANNEGRIFTITSDVNLTGLTFINGNCLNSDVNGKHGGAVFANGAVLNIDNCKFINNTAGSSGSYGGAVDVKASTAHIKDSTFEGNTAYYCGGGVYAESGNILLNISNCIFTENAILNTGWASGAAIYAYGTVLVDTSVFYNNTLVAGKNGRSIDHYGSNQLVVSNSVLLDGDKSVNVQTPSVATLDNNWWGNNNANKDTDPKDLGYTNANVDSYLIFKTAINQDTVKNGDEVTVTVSLNSNQNDEVVGNLPELPISLSTVLGTFNPDPASIANVVETT